MERAAGLLFLAYGLEEGLAGGAEIGLVQPRSSRWWSLPASRATGGCTPVTNLLMKQSDRPPGGVVVPQASSGSEGECSRFFAKTGKSSQVSGGMRGGVAGRTGVVDFEASSKVRDLFFCYPQPR